MKHHHLLQQAVTTSCFRLSLLLLLLLPYSSWSYTLITFDVDGTLIHGSGQAAAESAHALAFGHAVSTVLLGDGDGDGNYNDDDNDNDNKEGGGQQQQATTINVAEALPRRLYQGSTDGLILLRLAKATLGMEASESFPKLNAMMDCMYEYIQELQDSEINKHISALPGVMGHLETLAKMQAQQQGQGQGVFCGLVTGNVEGIARRKMSAVGILQAGALSPPCEKQQKWQGTEHLGFLGGFGSDYCSGDIDNLDRNFLDRGEQIAIATRRCQNMITKQHHSLEKGGDGDVGRKLLRRVVHVGDAPADVLAAKAFSQQQQQQQHRKSSDGDAANLCVGMVAVATGSYGADELRELAGDPIPGQWEPVVLEDGMGDPNFLKACGL